ncbi:uncharacterized protein RJT20DRAFT_131198 [Scheffersomyces xylosifermentans]|uniref:uncharacterized protein n=1 Tax=Scheffersomyces xylosifermentans TaxID=1304137 RepID=UPI00315C6C1F
MVAGKSGKILTVVFVSVLSWYTGLKFWKPIVIEKLEEEGRLRKDIDLYYDKDEAPRDWEDLKMKVKTSLHPELKEKYEKEHATEQTSKLLQQVKDISKEK